MAGLIEADNMCAGLELLLAAMYMVCYDGMTVASGQPSYNMQGQFKLTE